MRMKFVGLCVMVGASVACGDDAGKGSPSSGGDDVAKLDAGESNADDAGNLPALDAGPFDAGEVEDAASDDDASTPDGVTACASRSTDFPSTGDDESMQWWWGGSEAVRKVVFPKSADYLKSGSFTLGGISLASSEAVTVTLGGAVHEAIGSSIPAGTYTCAKNQAGINASSHGFAQSNVADSACEVTFTQAVEQGGLVEGTFWAFMPPHEALMLPGGCVTGRFSARDTP